MPLLLFRPIALSLPVLFSVQMELWCLYQSAILVVISLSYLLFFPPKVGLKIKCKKETMPCYPGAQCIHLV